MVLHGESQTRAKGLLECWGYLLMSDDYFTVADVTPEAHDSTTQIILYPFINMHILILGLDPSLATNSRAAY